MPDHGVTFHADLSDIRGDVDYYLAARGALHRLALHTAASRQQARAEAPWLAEIPDDRLTHYTPEPIPMASDVAVRVHIAYRRADGSLPERGPHAGHASMFCPLDPETGELARHHHVDWISTAKTYLTHHADLRTQNAQVAGWIAEHMDKDKAKATYELIDQLALKMRSMGEPSTEPGVGWAALEAVTYHGETRYLHRPRPEIVDAARPALLALMKSTKNDVRLEDKKWQQAPGFSTVQAPARLGTVTADGGWKATLSKEFAFQGVKSSITVEDAGKRRVRIQMTNTYVRYLAGYIQFFDADRKPLSVPSWQPVAGLPTWIEVLEKEWDKLQFQTDSFRYLGAIDPIDTILAVPDFAFPGRLVGENKGYGVEVDFPEHAASADIYACGLGLGPRPHPGATFYGTTLTIVCNLFVPALMMAFDVASNSYRPLYQFIQDLLSKTAVKIIGALVYLAKNISALVVSAIDGRPDWTQILDIVKTVFDKLFGFLLEWIEKDLAKNGVEDVAEKVAEEIPFAGWIVSAISIASDVAEMAETVVEVLSSQPEITNTIHLQIQSTVTLRPDPRTGRFPQPAADQKATCTLKVVRSDDGPTLTPLVQVPEKLGDKLEVSFANALGGSIRLEAEFRIDGALRAKATSGSLPNDLDHAKDIQMVFVDQPVHLGPHSRYEHGSVLIFDGGDYAWQQTVSPPTTLPKVDPSNHGNAFSEWNGLALDQHNHRLLWAWRAAGTGIGRCSDASTDVQVRTFAQAVAPTLAPAVRFPSCGFTDVTRVVSDPYPPKFLMKDGRWVLDAHGHPVPNPDDTDLGSFYVDPRKADLPTEQGGGYHLRKIPDTGAIDPHVALPSYGRFRFEPESLVLHPQGWTIGVSKKNRKIQVAWLPPHGAPDAALAYGQVYSGEGLAFHDSGSRPGLLVLPVAVCCAYDGTILILENLREADATMARVQAFDLRGNPVSCFGDGKGGHSPFLPLPSGDRAYLAIAAAGDSHDCNVFLLYRVGDAASAGDYKVDVFTYSEKSTSNGALLTIGGVPAAGLAADLWNTLYTLDYGMTTDGHGHPAGPKVAGAGPAGRSVPAVSSWLPEGT